MYLVWINSLDDQKSMQLKEAFLKDFMVYFTSFLSTDTCSLNLQAKMCLFIFGSDYVNCVLIDWESFVLSEKWIENLKKVDLILYCFEFMMESNYLKNINIWDIEQIHSLSIQFFWSKMSENLRLVFTSSNTNFLKKMKWFLDIKGWTTNSVNKKVYDVLLEK